MHQVIKLPGKTFILGEYLATQGGKNLIFTSNPCFELKIEKKTNKQPAPFHPESPAGKFYSRYQKHLEYYQFTFYNSYQLGGLGASTAEFLGLYLFTQQLVDLPLLSDKSLIKLYQSLCSSKGTPPSGADLIAQRHQKINYLCINDNKQKSHDWPFSNLSLLLFHTNQKLATHEHLEKLSVTFEVSIFETIANKAYEAFTSKNSDAFINAINDYGLALEQLKLVAKHTQIILKEFKANPNILAAKGCGAMGADVILLLCSPNHKKNLLKDIQSKGFYFLADEDKLCK